MSGHDGDGGYELSGPVTRVQNRGDTWEVEISTGLEEFVVFQTRRSPPRCGSETTIVVTVSEP